MTRKLCKNVALGILPVAAGMGFIGLSAQAASAATEEHDLNVTFVDNEGDTWHCSLEGEQFYDSSAKQLVVRADVFEGGTGSTNEVGCLAEPEALPHFAPNSLEDMDTTFLQNSDGTQVETDSTGTLQAAATYSNVKDAKITTNFTMSFADCNPNLSQCSYTFALSQGK
jgi:hypothetical protein